jgi:hypothetical protein
MLADAGLVAEVGAERAVAVVEAVDFTGVVAAVAAGCGVASTEEAPVAGCGVASTVAALVVGCGVASTVAVPVVGCGVVSTVAAGCAAVQRRPVQK